MKPLLAIEGLSLGRASRNGAKAWRMQVDSFTLWEGAKIGLIGPSGSGKSSFLDFLALISAPASLDRMTLLGEEITQLIRGQRDSRISRLRASSMSYILQEGGLLPYLSLRENAKLAAFATKGNADQTIEALAEALDIAPLLGKKPGHLSGGQRQRAQVLRGLAGGAKILLADEPTAALDDVNAHRTFAAMTSVMDRGAMVVTSHWPDVLSAHGFTLCQVRLQEYDHEIVATLHAVEAA